MIKKTIILLVLYFLQLYLTSLRGKGDLPSLGFLTPPPFIFVPLSPPVAAALGPLAYSSRSARPLTSRPNLTQ